MEKPDVLVIGAGIIGCSLARELVRANVRVTLVDRGLVGGGASSAAAGLLAPTLSAATVGPLAELCHQSAALYEAWINELSEDGGGEVGFNRLGLLEVWTDHDGARGSTFNVEGSTLACRFEQLSAEDLRRRELALAPDVVGAGYYPDAAQVDPAKLTQAIARVAQMAGVTIRENEPVLRIVREGDRVSAVHTVTTCYWPGVVVLAAGAWTGALAEALELDLPTEPVKGQMVLARCHVSPVRTPLHAGDAVLVPRADGSLLLGVTVEDAGYDDQVTLDGVRSILSSTSALVPAVGKLPFVRAWAGLRPATPDGYPYMGPVPPLRNLWVSTGHFRKGILLAPLCARLMARSILADHPDDELLPFKPTRRLS